MSSLTYPILNEDSEINWKLNRDVFKKLRGSRKHDTIIWYKLSEMILKEPCHRVHNNKSLARGGAEILPCTHKGAR